jgi:hypothetical protein
MISNQETFVLTGTNNDLFEIESENIIPYSECKINNKPDLIGQKVTLKTIDGNYYNTCDFGLYEESKCDFNTENIKPLMTITNEKRCRQVPYEGPYK